MKTLGIIGGMGPEATNQLVTKIINKFVASGQKTRPDILVASLPINLAAETKLITDNDSGNFPLLMTKAAKRLELAGAEILVIACNSVHIFIDDVRKNVNIPVISAIEETKRQITSEKVGLLATTFTVRNKLFVSNKFELVVPEDNIQMRVSLMLDKLAKGEAATKFDKNMLEKVLNSFIDDGVEICILGCSELQLLGDVWQKFIHKIIFLDTMDILVNAAVKNLLN